MIELKTLEDLTFYPDFELEPDMIRKSELKAEAVKWVKEIDSQNTDVFGGLRTDIDKRWIINFFNLTEEDLK